MGLFKSSPNLAVGEKARLEYHMQQIADCIGAQRMQLPLLSHRELVSLGTADKSAETTGKAKIETVKTRLGEHLRHDVAGLKVQTFPMSIQKIGGGG